MKALLSIARGGPQTLNFAEVPAPQCLGHQVVIRVKAVAVTFVDSLIIRDEYQIKPERPFSPGVEVSGVIESAGSRVSQFAVGQRVVALCGWGGMAEFVAVDAARCVPIPAEMPFPTAAALLFSYVTAEYALVQRANICAGETLLVLGGGSGVGLAAVELGCTLGAQVVAAASAPDKLDLARSRGASAAVLYPKGPLDAAASRSLLQDFRSALGGAANLVFDCVGGDYAEPAARCMAWGGRYLIVGFAAGVPRLPLNIPVLKGCSLLGVLCGAWLEREPESFQKLAQQLVAACHAGRIRPCVSDVLPFSEAKKALQALAERGTTGRVVLTLE